jgi:hypothetical protein
VEENFQTHSFVNLLFRSEANKTEIIKTGRYFNFALKEFIFSLIEIKHYKIIKLKKIIIV